MEQPRWRRFNISVGGPCNHACGQGTLWTGHCRKILEMENGEGHNGAHLNNLKEYFNTHLSEEEKL